jgi:acyl-CoA thioesterase
MQFEIEKIMEERNLHNAFGNLLGIRLLEYREGFARAEMPVKPEFLNPLGTVHGGCLYSLADSVGGCASATYGSITPTISGDLHFLRPAIGFPKLLATANVIRHGRSIAVFEVEITDPSGEKKIAHGTFSYYTRTGENTSDTGRRPHNYALPLSD